MIDVNRKEVLRYLGYKNHEAQQDVSDLIEQCIDELKTNASPKSTHIYLPLKITNNIINIQDLAIDSNDLLRNLHGCDEVVIFAATLGVKIDILIKKYMSSSISRAVVLQAASSAYIEEYCDLCQSEIELDCQKRDMFVRPRFSAGYGDFSLLNQKDIIRILDAPKKVGITITDSFLLAPSKSITAIMGISSINIGKCLKGCEICTKLDCNYKRS